MNINTLEFLQVPEPCFSLSFQINCATNLRTCVVKDNGRIYRISLLSVFEVLFQFQLHSPLKSVGLCALTGVKNLQGLARVLLFAYLRNQRINLIFLLFLFIYFLICFFKISCTMWRLLGEQKHRSKHLYVILIPFSHNQLIFLFKGYSYRWRIIPSMYPARRSIEARKTIHSGRNWLQIILSMGHIPKSPANRKT